MRAGGEREAELSRLSRTLAEAEKHRDVGALDELLAEDYEGVDAQGRPHAKLDVLARFASPDLRITSLTTSDLKVRLLSETAVVSGRSHTKGSFKGQRFGGVFRFTEVWVHRQGRWLVTASQMTLEAER